MIQKFTCNACKQDHTKTLDEWCDRSLTEVLLDYKDNKIAKLEQALAVAEDAIKNTEKALDSIKYELNASVYTLTDDEFETTFSCRDNLFLALKEIKAIKEAK